MGNQITVQEYEANRALMNCGKERCDHGKNSKRIEKFLKAYNMHDRKYMQNLLAEGATFSFKGGDVCLPLDMFVEQIEQIQDSFPDVFISWDDIREDEPGVVKVSNLCSRGKHTGKPYSYGPLPPIAATGIVVEEGPTQMVYIFENAKLTHIQTEPPVGDVTGPPGYYTKIGGKIDATE